MVKVMSLVVKAGSGLRCGFVVRAWTEMEIRCVKGMYRLKLVPCENNTGFKGLTFRMVSTVHYFHNLSLGILHNQYIKQTQP